MISDKITLKFGKTLVTVLDTLDLKFHQLRQIIQPKFHCNTVANLSYWSVDFIKK
jgi:hypothetical protein